MNPFNGFLGAKNEKADQFNTVENENMNFGKYKRSAISELTHRIPLFDLDGEKAIHDNKEMFITITSNKSPEYQAALNRQANKSNRGKNKDFDINDLYMESAQLCAAAVVECEIYCDGWISLNASSTKEEKESAKKQLREFFNEIPDMVQMVNSHMENQANFLEQSEKNSSKQPSN